MTGAAGLTQQTAASSCWNNKKLPYPPSKCPNLWTLLSSNVCCPCRLSKTSWWVRLPYSVSCRFALQHWKIKKFPIVISLEEIKHFQNAKLYFFKEFILTMLFSFDQCQFFSLFSFKLNLIYCIHNHLQIAKIHKAPHKNAKCLL